MKIMAKTKRCLAILLMLTLCLGSFLPTAGVQTVRADDTVSEPAVHVWFAYSDGKIQKPDKDNAIILRPEDVGQFKTDVSTDGYTWNCEEKFLIIGEGRYDDHVWIHPETGAFQPCEYVPTRGGVTAEIQDKTGKVLYTFIIRIVDEGAVIKAVLETLIETAEKRTEEDYTVDSWSDLQTALETAKKVDADGNVKQNAVDSAVENLRQALNGLVTKAESVMAQIKALPATDKLTLADKEKVEAARKAYEALSDSQKEAVGNVETLTKAQVQIKKLTEDAENQNKPSAPAQPGNTNTKPSTPAPVVKPFTVQAVSAGYNKINISWNGQEGVSGYTVYRAESAKGKYKAVTTVSAHTGRVTDKKVTAGKTYYYKVSAFKKTGSKITGQTYTANICSAKPVPAAAVISKASAGSKKATLQWKKVSGASGYQLYRADSQNGRYKCIKTQKSSKYTNKKLKKGKTYYYKVRAYRKVGSKKVYGSYSPARAVNVK